MGGKKRANSVASAEQNLENAPFSPRMRPSSHCGPADAVDPEERLLGLRPRVGRGECAGGEGWALATCVLHEPTPDGQCPWPVPRPGLGSSREKRPGSRTPEAGSHGGGTGGGTGGLSSGGLTEARAEGVLS